MKKCIADLAEKCKEEIEEAAYESYYNGGNPNYFKGCTRRFFLNDNIQVEISTFGSNEYEVAIYGDREYPNIEKAIEDFLSENTEPSICWQSAYDNDEWWNVDSGCDPAFPRQGDFEKWAYGS